MISNNPKQTITSFVFFRKILTAREIKILEGRSPPKTPKRGCHLKGGS